MHLAGGFLFVWERIVYERPRGSNWRVVWGRGRRQGARPPNGNASGDALNYRPQVPTRKIFRKAYNFS